MKKTSAQPDSGKYFVLPEHLVLAKMDELRRARITVRKVEAIACGLTFDAYLVRKNGTRGGLERVLAVLSLSQKQIRREKCFVNDCKYELVTVSQGRVRIHDSENVYKRNKTFQATSAYRRELENFSRLLGGVELHFHCAKLFERNSFPNVPGCYRIFTNSSPAGEASFTFGTTIFGMPLDKDGFPVKVTKPTPGRGLSMEDQEEQPCVQVLGNTIYFLVPTVGNYRGEISRIIFKKLFIAGWDGIRLLAKEKKTKPLSKRACAGIAKRWVDGYPNGVEEEMALLDDKIARVTKELAGYLRNKQEFASILALLNTPGYARRAKKRLVREFDKLMANPDFERVSVVDEGLHLATKRIIPEHNGRGFDLGRFVIRIGRNGRVSVWSEEPTHPRRIPHPHIDADSGPCFGNATEAIIKAAAEERYADAASMTLRWLRDGYSPELAAVKIEEWPVVKEGMG